MLDLLRQNQALGLFGLPASELPSTGTWPRRASSPMLTVVQIPPQAEGAKPLKDCICNISQSNQATRICDPVHGAPAVRCAQCLASSTHPPTHWATVYPTGEQYGERAKRHTGQIHCSSMFWGDFHPPPEATWQGHGKGMARPDGHTQALGSRLQARIRARYAPCHRSFIWRP